MIRIVKDGEPQKLAEPEAPKTNPHLIESLRNWLAQAEAGVITGAVLVGVAADGGCLNEIVTGTWQLSALGGLSMAEHRLIHMIQEQT